VTSRDPVIVGVAESDLGIVGPDRNELQLQAQAASRALADAGLSLRDVDGLLTASVDAMPVAMRVAEYLGITPTYIDSTYLGGASFVTHVGHAALALRAGMCEVALITYGSTQRSQRSRTFGAQGGVRFEDQYEQIWGLPQPLGAYALAATRHQEMYGTTSEQLAEVAVAARRWAALNPVAFERGPLTIEDVLSSPVISSPLHQRDCCLVTDGGGAIVMTTAERARDLPGAAVRVLGHGEASTHNRITSSPDLLTVPASISAPRALEMAGVGIDDIDVFELYDSFTITVLLTLEAIGCCKPGEGGSFVEGQRTAPGGEVALNTSGGGLSYGHPGMFGIFTVIEAVRQLRGSCGSRQVAGAELALAHGTGGVMNAGSTVVLGRS
jgi:acetyl-CoA acetyltransferase